MFDPLTLQLLMTAAPYVAQGVGSALQRKSASPALGGATADTFQMPSLGGMRAGATPTMPNGLDALPSLAPSMTGGADALPSLPMAQPAMKGLSGGMMGSMMGGMMPQGGGGMGGGMGGSAMSLLGGALAGGTGGGMQSQSQFSNTSDPRYPGSTRNDWLAAMGTTRAQQQDRNQAIMGMANRSEEMLANFLSGSQWGRDIAGTPDGYQTQDAFSHTQPYELDEEFTDEGPRLKGEEEELEGKMFGGPITQSKRYMTGEAGPEIYNSPQGGSRVIGAQGPQVTQLQKGGFVQPNPLTQMMGGQGGSGNAMGGQSGIGLAGAGNPLMQMKMGSPLTQLKMGNQSRIPVAQPQLPQMRTMGARTAGGRPDMGSVGNSIGNSKTPPSSTGQSGMPTPFTPNYGQPPGLDPVNAGSVPTLDPYATNLPNAFSDAQIQQLSARATEGANIQNRNRNAAMAGQSNAMGVTGPNIAAVLGQPTSQEAARIGAQAGADATLAGKNLGAQNYWNANNMNAQNYWNSQNMNRGDYWNNVNSQFRGQELSNQYYMQMLNMLLSGANSFGNAFAMQPASQYNKGNSQQQSRDGVEDAGWFS
jgi:hypothetical protein